ncbi:hypothetical protein KL86DES1_21701 [uncultured Desulfovibrio sp.]|uniref:Uncharacterized protein n=1 Tax=uncultured Desulfovibrio sp. TaxID=167968 RepID=A0A212L967_9BACT|nr:hypothetical protein KL86DES1_21701 [uncultured Desulfovibrio sp.]VZH34606.1 conserved protein of unknown function [Desulfovibrio sp. 86]
MKQFEMLLKRLIALTRDACDMEHHLEKYT